MRDLDLRGAAAWEEGGILHGTTDDVHSVVDSPLVFVEDVETGAAYDDGGDLGVPCLQDCKFPRRVFFFLDGLHETALLRDGRARPDDGRGTHCPADTLQLKLRRDLHSQDPVLVQEVAG